MLNEVQFSFVFDILFSGTGQQCPSAEQQQPILECEPRRPGRGQTESRLSSNQETNQQPEPQFQPKESTTNQASLREVGNQVAGPLQPDRPPNPTYAAFPAGK